MSTLITNGTVVTHAGRMSADVLIAGEAVVGIAAPGAHQWTADRTIDATGKYLFPGGVDVHTHMELPFGGTFASDDFETGSRAAAWGGTTTIIDFAVQSIGEPVMDGYEAWRAKADGRCA
ncbi:MAG: dihydropyrimidinase, partial [Acidimicrobiia bacterium]